MERAYMCRHLLILLSCSVTFFGLLALFKWTPCFCVREWPLRSSAWQWACYWSLLCSHCAKAIQMPMMSAGHACRVRMLVQCARTFVSLHVHVCTVECFSSRPRVTPCCDPSSLLQWGASHCCCWPETLCICVWVLVNIIGLNQGRTLLVWVVGRRWCTSPWPQLE